jgi:hypothetical protein
MTGSQCLQRSISKVLNRLIQSVKSYPCLIKQNPEALTRGGHSTPIHGQVNEKRKKNQKQSLWLERKGVQDTERLENGRMLGGKPLLLEAINV